MKPSFSRPPSEIGALLMLLDEAFNKPAWHGPNLRGALRRVDATQAAWRPTPDRKNIWEITVHAAYWKYTVVRHLTGAKQRKFALVGSNWFIRNAPDEAAWKSDVKLLEQMHADLRAAVASLAPDHLEAKPPLSKHSRRRLIQGAALHDTYHTGQIQTLKRLYAG